MDKTSAQIKQNVTSSPEAPCVFCHCPPRVTSILVSNTLLVSPACLGRTRGVHGTLVSLASFAQNYVHELQAGCCVQLQIARCPSSRIHRVNYATGRWPLCHLLMSGWVAFSLGLLKKWCHKNSYTYYLVNIVCITVEFIMLIQHKYI